MLTLFTADNLQILLYGVLGHYFFTRDFVAVMDAITRFLEAAAALAAARRRR